MKTHFEGLADEEKRRHALLYPEYRYAPKKLGMGSPAPSQTRVSSLRNNNATGSSHRSHPPPTRAASTHCTFPSTPRPSTKLSRTGLPTPLPSPTSVSSHRRTTEALEEADDTLESYDIELEDEDTQPWDNLFSNVLTSTHRLPPVSLAHTCSVPKQYECSSRMIR